MKLISCIYGQIGELYGKFVSFKLAGLLFCDNKHISLPLNAKRKIKGGSKKGSNKGKKDIADR